MTQTQQESVFTPQAVLEELIHINGDYADDFPINPATGDLPLDAYFAIFSEFKTMFLNDTWKQRFLTSSHQELYFDYAEVQLQANLLDTQIVFEEALKFMLVNKR